MSEITVKVFKIIEENAPFLIQIGFSIAKLCGYNMQGFKLALGLGYLEALALRKNFHYTNFQFLYSHIDYLFSQSNTLKLSAILKEILRGNFEQELIVKEARESAEFREQVIDFAKHIFNIGDDLDSIMSVLQFEYFIKALSELNIQFQMFSRFELIYEQKRNHFVHPLVICLFRDDDDGIFNLYHQDYKEIKYEHWNTDLEIFPKHENCYLVDYLKDTIKILIENLPEAEKLKIQEKFQIN